MIISMNTNHKQLIYPWYNLDQVVCANLYFTLVGCTLGIMQVVYVYWSGQL